MERFGLTIPLDGTPIPAQTEFFKECADLGYTDLWSMETNGIDGFTPLAYTAAVVPDVRLGIAIAPAYTRGPALMAQTIAGMAECAPGRFAVGIGSSSDVIVGRWNGIPFDEPYKKVRDTVRFVKAALTGEKVDVELEAVLSSGFRLARKPASPPTILVAALRQGMLRMAGRESDGAIINWLSADDVKTVAPEVGAGKEVVARIFVCPSPNADFVRAAGKRVISSYLTVEVYAKFHEWLGRGDRLGKMWELWKAGDRQGATNSIPDSVVDELIVHGPPEACREQIARYVENGVTTPVVNILPFGVRAKDAARSLAPSSTR